MLSSVVESRDVKMAYWDQTVECMDRPQLEAMQLELLRQTLRRAYDRVPLYRSRFDAMGIKPEDVRSLSDVRSLPFTTKQDLRDNYPFGMFAVPMDDIVRVHASSGTTGKPTVVGYTRADLGMWAELMSRTLLCGDVSKSDVIHVAYGYGLFTGGLGVHYGAERVGASVIPVSGGNTKRQIMLLADFGATVLCCTPTYALYIAETAEELGVNLTDLRLRVGFFGAEPWSENMRHELEAKLHIDAIDIYGLSEVIGPGVASECMAKCGLHVWEDHFIPEIVNPETGEVLPDGSLGELVFTSIRKEALPIIRYRTRDISSITHEPCVCGRTHARISRISGRTDDMLIIRGVNVFPSQIESVLLQIDEVEPHYQIIVDRKGRLDDVELLVEVSSSFFSDQVKRLEQLGNRIRSEIESTLGLAVRVRLVEPKTIERSEGKARRVIDKRSL